MAFPSSDFTFSCAGPLLTQQQYDTDMDMDMTSALFSADPCLDEYFKDDFDTYFNFANYDDVQDAESPASLPSSPSSTDTDSDGSYPDTPPLEDDSSFTPSPAISPSLLSSPSASPALPHAKVPTVIAIEDSDIDAEGETDDGSEYEDSDGDSSFDPEEELRAVRSRKRAQQSRTVRRSNASSSSKPPRAKQYKSKQSSRRGSRSSKSAPRARSRSSSSTSASRIFDSPIKPRYRYCKPRARQVSFEEYQDWLKDPRAKNFKCPYKCGYSQDRSPDLYRHIDTHHQTARGTAFVCCGVPISELPALLPKDGSVSDYQLYEYQGGLWAGGCFQVISRKDAMLRHWGLHSDFQGVKNKKKCKCIPTKEMVEINLHENHLV